MALLAFLLIHGQELSRWIDPFPELFEEVPRLWTFKQVMPDFIVHYLSSRSRVFRHKFDGLIVTIWIKPVISQGRTYFVHAVALQISGAPLGVLEAKGDELYNCPKLFRLVFELTDWFHGLRGYLGARHDDLRLVTAIQPNTLTTLLMAAKR